MPTTTTTITKTKPAKASWGDRLTQKLSSLGENSSKESIQTLAMWIAFNRKHAVEFAGVAEKKIQGAVNNPKLNAVYLAVIHEVLLLHKDPPANNNPAKKKWDQCQELRIALGESTLLPCIAVFSNAPLLKEKLTSMLSEWDNANTFGGPTLINLLKKKLSTKPTSPSKTSPSKQQDDAGAVSQSSTVAPQQPAVEAKLTDENSTSGPQDQAVYSSIKPSVEVGEPDSTIATAESPSKTDATGHETPLPDLDLDFETSSAEKTTKRKDPPVSDTSESRKEARLNDEALSVDEATPSAAAVVSGTTTATATATVVSTKEYDFEESGVPKGKVHPSEFLDPCRAIATLQIARDLRNDGAVQLASLFSSLPQPVRAAAAEAAEQEDLEEYPLTDEQAKQFATMTPETLIDMDLDEQLLNVRTFAGLVEKQREARQQILFLLLKSRCQFGSHDAARCLYEDTEKIEQELHARKQLLHDAMELEGMDVVAEESPKKKGGTGQEQQELPPLPWYTAASADANKDDESM